jgi:hypothetical protein
VKLDAMDASALHGIFQAYREGLLRKVPAGRSPQVLLIHILLNRYPLRERLPLRRILSQSCMGVATARKGRLEEAARQLDTGREALGRPELSEEGSRLGTSMLESAQAYLDYREERFDEARERIGIAMEMDLLLEQEEDYSILEMHRIQAVQNLVRIDLRAGFPERALSLAGCILAYLEGLTDHLPVHRSWRNEKLLRIPLWNRRAMAAQIANEAAVGLHQWPGPPRWDAFYRSGPGEAPGLHPRVRQWLRLRQALETGAGDGLYPGLLIDFLRDGRGDLAPIWYSSVVDFLDFCDQTGSPPALRVRDWILRDAPKWPAVPPALQSCLFRDGVRETR